MTIEQLRDLVERLQADPAQVTDEELASARDFIAGQREHFAEQPPSEDVIAALTELRDSRAAVVSVQEQRAASMAALDEQRQELLGDLADNTADSTPGTTPETAEPQTETADNTADEEDQGSNFASTTRRPPPPRGDDDDEEEEEEDGRRPMPAVSADAKPRRAPIGAFTAQTAPARPAPVAVHGNVVAAGGSRNFTQGQQITSTAQLAQAFTEKLRSMASGHAVGGGDKVYVANVNHVYPEDRVLRASDWVGNFTKIEQVTGENALVAAGGLCAPLETLYDVEVIGSSARPIRNALARFQVDRGGIQFRPHSSAASALIGGDGTGVAKWSMAQDERAADPNELKGCYVVDCPAIEEAEIHAVYLCLEFGSITARFDPETTAAHVREGMIAHARKAENELLRLLQEGSKVLSGARVVGAVRDILANIDKATAYYRNRHRIDTRVNLRWLAPAWVLYLMRTDLARQMAAGDWMEALDISDQQITSWFRRRGVTPIWHLDGGIGGTSEVQTVTVTGSPTGGSYTLTFDGQTTVAIDFDATAAEVQAALEDLSNIAIGDVTAAGGPHPGTAITVAFGGNFEMTDVAEMTADDTNLTGGTSPAVAVTTTTTASTLTTVNGVSIASQVYAEAAAGAAIPGYPDQIDSLLYVDGTKLFLDGGSLDLGLVRDSGLNSRNRYRQFSETFEGVADRGIENLRLAMTVQPTGQTSGTKDLDAITD